ncbi:hypothetical protein H4S02_013394 [Coemansia sp. RSA 2611]|nr:hypothetical protein H4S02_013394 [Coemansia sp. RSA 2611]KAJ2369560.1 hypothetical protein H4S01_000927 [Coemansia sp. RSA 2610]
MKYTLTCSLYSAEQWASPECLETGGALEFAYAHDGVTQCSVQHGTAFHRLLLETQPLRCRLGAVEFPAALGGKQGSFNAVLHGRGGSLLAGAIYPVTDTPLPGGVEGVTTMLFHRRWYQGPTTARLMANQRAEEEFIISPIVALMFCVLTACAVYVAGRVYVEGTLVPRIRAESKKSD